MRTLGIFGTGGFSREIGDIAVELGYQIVFIAQTEPELNAWSFGDEVILESEAERHRNQMVFAIGVGHNAIRKKIYDRFAPTLRFATLIHPSASFGRRQRAVLEQQEGNIVCAGVRFTNNIAVGHFNIFNLNATVGHDVIVEDFVNIAPGANISGNVHLRSGCWIGTGAAINQGSESEKLIIGEYTTVGSGSVVTRSCEPNSIYVGAPAKRIK